jgi:8-oxo-dGTP pyrophosphatase MutT (NUDIX family)
MCVYPELWEFAPAGMMEPNQKPEDIIARELEEETGLMLSSPPTAIALFFDEEAQTWEIVFQLAVIGTCHRDETEYESLGWFDIKSMPAPMSPPALRMQSLL